jgi:hypothetical protein
MELGLSREAVTVVQPLKNFPEFYGTQRFITAFTRAFHQLLDPVLIMINPVHTTPSYLSKIHDPMSLST